MTARRLALVVVALCALGVPRAPAAKGLSYGDIARVAKAFEEWRYEEAAAIIGGLAKQAPDDEEVRLLSAQLAFYQGDYARAEDLLQKIKAPSLAAAVKEWLPLVHGTREATRDMLSRESPAGRFVIFYQPGKDELLVDLAGEALDAQWQALADDLGYTPPGKVRVEILPKVSDLARVSPLPMQAIETSGTIALCKYGKLMVVTPRATLLGYPWMDTLAHEYTHYAVTRASNNTVPIWLHEGLAKYEESRWRAAPGAAGMGRVHEHLLGQALKKGRLISFEEMHPSIAYLPSQEAAATAFAEVYAFVDWLQQEKGYAGVRSALAKMKDGKSERRALAEVFDMRWEDVEAAWRKSLKTLVLRTDPHMRNADRIKWRKSDGDDENVGIDAISEEKARKHARLGGLLRARGRLKAAAIEYEKALAIVGATDPFLSSKLARTYLDLGDAARAVATLEALEGRDPEDAGLETTLGMAYLKLGDLVKAGEHLEAAVRVQPFDPAVRCGLAEVYTASGHAAAPREQTACRAAK